MRPLIIGEAPSKNEVPPTPLGGRVGRRLAACCGITLEEFLVRFERVNLLDVRQDTREKGFEFDATAAAHAASLLIRHKLFDEPRLVLLLGRRVAQAFGCDVGYFNRWFINQAEAYVLPHPSGVSRWWNSVENQQHAAAFMRSIIAETHR